MKPINVLSCFDGISAGQLALKRSGIPVANYFASEIDPFAIKITQKNFPDTIQLGNINNWSSWNLPHIDLLIGGSPCQGFSVSGLKLNFDDPRSKLFFEFVDIKNKLMPNHFLLENVKMKKEWSDIITNMLGVGYIELDSSLVSAQSRKRYYWSDIKIDPPKDKGILLASIIENGSVDREKSYCVDANYYKGGSVKTLMRNYFDKSRRQIININDAPQSVRRLMVLNENENYRMLTPLECERLQTFPDGYTEGISNTQRYKSLGNSWTVDMISHIFDCLKEV
jgi:site-specific DNA-cytosine methylase